MRKPLEYPKYKGFPLPSPPVNHETRWVIARADEWARTVTNFGINTPNEMVAGYQKAFNDLTEAGRVLARYQDQLEAEGTLDL